MKKNFFDFRSLSRQLVNLLKKDRANKEDMREQDISKIEASSRLLGISEFRFFQLAYSQWYGREMPESSMEHIFADYMLKNVVPHWARHLSRIVLSRYFEGTLEPQDFNIPLPLESLDLDNSKSVNTIFMPVIYLIFYIILSGFITFF